jgi:hypothetical protein
MTQAINQHFKLDGIACNWLKGFECQMMFRMHQSHDATPQAGFAYSLSKIKTPTSWRFVHDHLGCGVLVI